MKIYYDQLPQNLKKSFGDFYFIYGAPEVLANNAKDLIEEAASNDGYSTEKFFIDSRFDADELFSSISNIGLFHKKRLIQLHCFDSKIPPNLNDFIIRYLEAPIHDIKCLVKLGKLASAIPAKLTKLMNAKGTVIPIYPLKDWQIVNWVKSRAQAIGLTLSHDNLKLIMDYADGSVDIASQILAKLHLEYGGNAIENSSLKDRLYESHEYELFDLMTQALSGNVKKALDAIAKIKSSTIELPIVLWLVANDIRELSNMSYKISQGAPIDDVVSKTMPMKRKIFALALNRIRHPQLVALTLRLPHIDKISKGLSRGDPWVELQQIILSLCGSTILPSYIEQKNNNIY